VAFNEQYVMVQVEFRKTKLTFGLDTGSETSSLEPRFAKTFSDLLAEVELRIGGFPTVLRPARILFNGSAGGCSYGSLGMDLMKQSQKTEIDFESMTLAMR
jgi:hypothetical protein